MVCENIYLRKVINIFKVFTSFQVDFTFAIIVILILDLNLRTFDRIREFLINPIILGKNSALLLSF